MKKPTTLRGFLRLLIWVADSGIADLRGTEKLSDAQRLHIGSLVGGLQNELGDIEEILKKHGLQWPPEK